MARDPEKRERYSQEAKLLFLMIVFAAIALVVYFVIQADQQVCRAAGC